MAVSWATFFPYIQPHVPGCPEMTIEQHLQEAAVDFCERSAVWRFDIGVASTSAGVSDYAISKPVVTTATGGSLLLENGGSLLLENGGRLLSEATPAFTTTENSATLLENVLALYLNGVPLSKVVDSSFFQSNQAAHGRPTSYSIYQDTMIRFYPTPDAIYTFEGTGVAKPSLAATGVEDYIYNTHGRAIACGALGKLLNIPGKEWTNPELAAYYTAKSAKAADDAMGRDMARGEMRVRPQGFERATPRRGF